MATEPTIERKQYSDHRAKAVMLTALRGRGAKLTRADAIVASGLPEDEAQRALTTLLKEYRSHLSATASGELLYEFDPRFARRDAVPFRERAAAVEDQYRYPPQEDIWEVSCGEWEKDEKPVLTTGRRRAS